MKVTLIYPAMGKRENDTYYNSKYLEPISIAVIAGLTPADINVEFFDDRFDKIDYDTDTDLVALSVQTHTALRAYQISARFREMGVPVVMGGFHPTLLPDEVIQHADAIVIGEAEYSWHRVLRDAEKGNLQRIYHPEFNPNDDWILPDRSIFSGKKYAPIAMIEASRGCKYACSFCSVSRFFNKSYQERPVEDIIWEIRLLKRKFVGFTDDNLFYNYSRAEELFKALSKVNVYWFAQINIKSVDDDEVLKLMAKSGCAGIFIGFESISRKNIKEMNKGVNTKTGYAEAIRKIRNAGIMVHASFLFGYEDDTIDTFDETLKFCMDNKVGAAYFNHLHPFPGTSVYDKFKQEKRLIYDRWWLNPGYRFGNVAFMHDNLPPDVLEKKCTELKQRFYSNRSILKRSLDFKANCRNLSAAAMYFYNNLWNRRECVEKVRLRLGSHAMDEKEMELARIK